MERPFINRLRIQNYGCIKDATFELSRLHALVGPNDSGKSTVLRALRTITTLADQPLGSLAHDEGARLTNALRAGLSRGPTIVTSSVGDAVWEVAVQSNLTRTEQVDVGQQRVAHQANIQLNQGTSVLRHDGLPGALVAATRGSQLLRLEADALRESSSLIPEGQPLQLLDTRGRGLPAIYDAIVTRDLPAYVAIGQQFTALFPSVKGLSLKNLNQSSKALGIQLLDGTSIGADFMSEGMLYWLAYAATPYLQPTALLLVEEPENGLHPARIREVVQVLRDLSKKTQVIMATHSPLVVNELQPDEVTVVTRDAAAGTRLRPIKDTPHFEERSKVYALGELWLSYANGKDEAPLFSDEGR